jgi:hypothetical protein
MTYERPAFAGFSFIKGIINHYEHYQNQQNFATVFKNIRWSCKTICPLLPEWVSLVK